MKTADFTTWLRHVDRHMIDTFGLAHDDLPDALWRDKFDDGLSPIEAIDSCVDDEWAEMHEVGESRSYVRGAIARGDRPTVLFDYPIPAEVIALTPDGPVHHVRWRDGDEPAVACFGPERISGEWWRGPDATRDCFRVQCANGRWLWVVRGLETGRWFVHGVWD